MTDALTPFSLTGRTAVVTGGARGIGRAVARLFVQAGATVALADRDLDAAEATARALNGMVDAEIGGGAFATELDVTSKPGAERAAEEILGRLGHLDILVNNAGIVKNAPSLEVTEEDWRQVIDVNLNGVFFCAQAFGRPMVARGRGAVVNIASIAGAVPVHPQPQASYNAAKAGVNLITKSLALEWAKAGVRVNAVAPGYVATDLTLAGRARPEWYKTWLELTPMGRFAEPAEIAHSVLFLASEAASYITGTTLTVDGGYTAF